MKVLFSSLFVFVEGAKLMLIDRTNDRLTKGLVEITHDDVNPDELGAGGSGSVVGANVHFKKTASTNEWNLQVAMKVGSIKALDEEECERMKFFWRNGADRVTPCYMFVKPWERSMIGFIVKPTPYTYAKRAEDKALGLNDPGRWGIDRFYYDEGKYDKAILLMPRAKYDMYKYTSTYFKTLKEPVRDRVRLELAMCVIEAINGISGLGYVHRDVKPENFLLFDDPAAPYANWPVNWPESNIYDTADLPKSAYPPATCQITDLDFLEPRRSQNPHSRFTIAYSDIRKRCGNADFANTDPKYDLGHMDIFALGAVFLELANVDRCAPNVMHIEEWTFLRGLDDGRADYIKATHDTLKKPGIDAIGTEFEDLYKDFGVDDDNMMKHARYAKRLISYCHGELSDIPGDNVNHFFRRKPEADAAKLDARFKPSKEEEDAVAAIVTVGLYAMSPFRKCEDTPQELYRHMTRLIEHFNKHGGLLNIDYSTLATMKYP